MPDLSRVEMLDPRYVWLNEATDFTPWLVANADALADTLGIDIELDVSEHPIGAFRLDVLGRDLTNGCGLMVENQLTTTDHSHLGQLITYAAGTEAGTVVWMSPQFREEHRQALDYLNNLAGGNVRFFGVEIAVCRIDGSRAAPLFRLRAQPNDWHAQVSASAKASTVTGKGALYQNFWAQFLPRLHAEQPGWTRATKPQPASWMNLPAPVASCVYSISFASKHRLRVELYIDGGDAAENDALLEGFQADRQVMESVFGGPLSFEPLPGKRACRIAAYGVGDVTEEGRYNEMSNWFIDALTRLRAAVEATIDLEE
jgi:hypothetical protein